MFSESSFVKLASQQEKPQSSSSKILLLHKTFSSEEVRKQQTFLPGNFGDKDTWLQYLAIKISSMEVPAV